MREYRGIEYVMRRRRPNRWQWELYEVGATIGFDKAEIDGTREDAVVCAHDAIERWVEEASHTSGRKFTGKVKVDFVMHQIRRLERLAKRTRHYAEKCCHKAAIAHLKKQLRELTTGSTKPTHIA